MVHKLSVNFVSHAAREGKTQQEAAELKLDLQCLPIPPGGTVYTTDIHQRYQTYYTYYTMGLNLGSSGFCLTTHAKANAKQMRSQSSCAKQHFMHVCLHAQTAVHTGNICTWQTTIILITGKTWRPPNRVPCRDQNGTGSGISGVYLWSILIQTFISIL